MDDICIEPLTLVGTISLMIGLPISVVGVSALATERLTPIARMIASIT